MAPYMLESAAAALPKLDLASLVGRQYRFDEVQQAYEACNTGRYPRVVVQIAP